MTTKDDDNTRATNQKQQSNFIPRQEQSAGGVKGMSLPFFIFFVND
jgi:hypothetical protein